jgi:HK97 family phage portal protein
VGALSRAISAPPRQRSHAGTVLRSIFGDAGAQTDAEIAVTATTALGLPAFGMGVRVIARNVGTLPLVTYEGDDEDRRRARDHPTYELLRRRPNPAMVSSVCWTTLVRHMVGWGQGFLGVDRVHGRGGDRVAGLWPIPPEKVIVETKGGEKRFKVMTGRGPVEYSADDVVHVLLDSHDGYVGISPITQHRQALGYELALQRYGSKSIGGRAVPAGYLKVKGKLADKAPLRREWENLYKDSALAHKIAVLDDEAEFKGLTIPLVDAQFIEQRRYGLIQFAQILTLPVHKLQGSTGDSLTYNTREGNQLEFLEALRPYMVGIEDALNARDDLLPDGRYCEFLPEALLRVEAKTRAEIHQIETGRAPWKKPSEVRREENLPAADGFDYVPQQTAGAAGKTTPSEED